MDDIIPLMIIGIDIGGSKIRIGLSYQGLELEDSITIATPQNQRKVIATLSHEIKKLVGGQQLDAIGISCPAPLDKARGMITQPHYLDWHNLRLVQPLRKAFDCQVVIEHDATAAGIYESRFGAGKDYHLVSYITISTGIGNALLLDGRPISNQHNPEAGSQIIDIHALEPNTREGKFSLLASGKAIERDFGELASEITSRNQWQIIAHRLSYGIFNIIQISAPDCVVLGGGVAEYYKRFGSLLLRDMKNLGSVYPLPPIIKAKHANTAPLLGAIWLAGQAIDV
jgi:glucokinase